MTTKKELIDKIRSFDNEEEFQGADFDHRKFKSLKDGKIIFSEDAFYRVLLVLRDTKYGDREEGFFLFGYKVGENIFYIEDAARNRFISEGTAVRNGELANNEMLCAIADQYDVVVHLHVHPQIGNKYERFYSNQDLFCYGFMQRAVDDAADVIGALGCFNENATELNFVYYDDRKKDFYRIDNVYYYSGNDLMKLQSIDKVPTIYYDTVDVVSDSDKKKLLKQIKR